MRWVVSLLAIASCSCVGYVGDPKGARSQNSAIDCTGNPAVAVPLRRINKRQYENSVRAIFGSTPGLSFPATTQGLGYSTNADANGVSLLGAERILEAAEESAVSVVARLPAILSCTPRGDEACALEFVRTYGRRVVRRSLRESEELALMQLYREARVEMPFADSLGVVTVALLQMPQFIYLIERTTLDADAVAARLAFLLTDATPDQQLLDAARDGGLDEPAEIEAQARRLLPNSRRVLEQFHREWLEVDNVENQVKSAASFPEWNATLRSSVAEELNRFVGLVLDGDARWSTVLTSRETFVNRPLAELYGLPAATSRDANDWQRVSLAENERAGLLTRAAVMASHANADSTSPIFRGRFVRTQLLCDDVPAPPPNAQESAPEYPAGATIREKSTILTEAPSCGGCHVLMNPVGLGFENYNAIGRFRTSDTDGSPIDASGEVLGLATPAFNGAVELSQRLAENEQVRRCFVQQVFRFTYAKQEVGTDACTIDELDQLLVDRDGRMDELMVGIAVRQAAKKEVP